MADAAEAMRKSPASRRSSGVVDSRRLWFSVLSVLTALVLVFFCILPNRPLPEVKDLPRGLLVLDLSTELSRDATGFEGYTVDRHVEPGFETISISVPTGVYIKSATVGWTSPATQQDISWICGFEKSVFLANETRFFRSQHDVEQSPIDPLSFDDLLMAANQAPIGLAPRNSEPENPVPAHVDHAVQTLAHADTRSSTLYCELDEDLIAELPQSKNALVPTQLVVGHAGENDTISSASFDSSITRSIPRAWTEVSGYVDPSAEISPISAVDIRTLPASLGPFEGAYVFLDAERQRWDDIKFAIGSLFVGAWLGLALERLIELTSRRRKEPDEPEPAARARSWRYRQRLRQSRMLKETQLAAKRRQQAGRTVR